MLREASPKGVISLVSPFCEFVLVMKVLCQTIEATFANAYGAV